MIKVRGKIKDETGQVLKKAKTAAITSLGQAGAYIRGIAKRSVKVSPKPAAPGSPPHSRQGKLKNAIAFAVEKDRQDVVVGPNASAVGQIGSTHEFGGVEPPKKPPVLRENNWVLRVGGHGPIRIEGDTVIVAKLTTPTQVELSKSLVPAAVELSHFKYVDALLAFWVGGASKVRHYPARPLMGPALQVSKARLPQFWANTVKKD